MVCAGQDVVRVIAAQQHSSYVQLWVKWSMSDSDGSWQSASPARGIGNTRNSRSGVRQFLLALEISIKTPQSPINGPKLARSVVSGGVPSMVQKLCGQVGGRACVAGVSVAEFNRR